jgi:hypothetical protein
MRRVFALTSEFRAGDAKAIRPIRQIESDGTLKRGAKLLGAPMMTAIM